MRALCRAVLIATLVASLADLPVASAANRPLGFVLAAESSHIDGLAATSGSNVFAGDALSTDPAGRIHVQFGADQIYLPSSSGVSLAARKDGVTAVLSSGTLEFAAPQGAGLAVNADDVLILPGKLQPTHAQVTLLAKDELKIAVVAGSLDLELDGKSYTLAPGRTYGVRVVNSNDKTQYPNRPAFQRRALVIFLFGTAAAVAAVIYLVQELHESPEVP